MASAIWLMKNDRTKVALVAPRQGATIGRDILGATTGGSGNPTPTASGLLTVAQGSPTAGVTSWNSAGAQLSSTTVGAVVGEAAWSVIPAGGNWSVTPSVEPPIGLADTAREVTFVASAVSSQGTPRQVRLGFDWFSGSGSAITFIQRDLGTAVQLTGSAQNITAVGVKPAQATMFKPVLEAHVAPLSTASDVVTIGEFRADVTLVGEVPDTGGGDTGGGTIPPGTRPAWLHPYSSTSWVNIPRATNAVMSDNSALRNSAPWVNNRDAYGHAVRKAKTTDPTMEAKDTASYHTGLPYYSPGPYYIKAPADLASWIAAGSDAHVHIVNPDGTIVYEMFQAKVANGRIENTRFGVHNLVTGDGLGPFNGPRAWGGSAIAGLIREYDIQRGVIDHAVAIGLAMSSQLGGATRTWDGKWNYYTDSSVTVPAPGWNARSRSGFHEQVWHVWPASENDYNAPTSSWYNGPFPMGTMFSIPNNVDVENIGLSNYGKMLARAVKIYGAYALDATGPNGPVFYVENTGSGTLAAQFTSQLVGPNWSAADLKIIQGVMRVVQNNTQSTPGGGPLSAARMGPLLPNPTAV